MSKRNPLIKAPPKPPRPTARELTVTWLKNGCCWFTLLCMGMLLLNLTVWSTNGVSPSGYILLLPLSLCLAGAGTVRRSDMSQGTRYLLHVLLSVGGTYTFGLLPYQIRSHARAGTMLILLLLLFAVYGLVVGIAALILHRKNTGQDAKTPYQSMFDHNK